MKVKVSEAEGQVLDWMVAICEGYTGLRKNPHRFDDDLIMTPPNKGYGPVYLHDMPHPSSWEFGGPIIEREGICLDYWNEDDPWKADMSGDNEQFGDTPLIAAMRCYVTSKLGDEVEVPDELLE